MQIYPHDIVLSELRFIQARLVEDIERSRRMGHRVDGNRSALARRLAEITQKWGSENGSIERRRTSLDPSGLAELGRAFDSAWDEVRPSFTGEPRVQEEARHRLATIFIAEWSTNPGGIEEVKAGALRRFRRIGKWMADSRY